MVKHSLIVQDTSGASQHTMDVCDDGDENPYLLCSDKLQELRVRRSRAPGAAERPLLAPRVAP